MAAPIEKWIKYNVDYQVSSLGRVKSMDRESFDSRGRHRFKKGRILSDKGRINGYPVVNIKGKAIKVHRLVAKLFLDNTKNHPVVNHKNGDKTDNRVENLEWCTQKYNCKHAYSIDLRKPVINKEEKNGFSKKVLNVKTNHVYGSLTQAMRIEKINMKYSTLRAKLSGQNPNNTHLKYL